MLTAIGKMTVLNVNRFTDSELFEKPRQSIAKSFMFKYRFILSVRLNSNFLRSIFHSRFVIWEYSVAVGSSKHQNEVVAKISS